MSVLTRVEIERRLARSDLLRNARRGDDGKFDIEADSYDLAAGTVIWKQPIGNGGAQSIKTLTYKPNLPKAEQPTVSVQPGQMVFVVTLEDVLMPLDLCGTVYSRNKLAFDGILALNAGHVDSGYKGPIAIRLINMRATPWTLALGELIFTIVFQTLDRVPDGAWNEVRIESQHSMVSRVRETADEALSNALYDLYSVNVDNRLNEFSTNFNKELGNTWVRRDDLWSALLSSTWSRLVALVLGLAVLGGAMFAALTFFQDKV